MLSQNHLINLIYSFLNDIFLYHFMFVRHYQVVHVPHNLTTYITPKKRCIVCSASIVFSSFTDIDECGRSENLCDDNSVCRNIEGSYECTCKSGYRNIEGSFLCIGKASCLQCIKQPRQWFCEMEPPPPLPPSLIPKPQTDGWRLAGTDQPTNNGCWACVLQHQSFSHC